MSLLFNPPLSFYYLFSFLLPSCRLFSSLPLSLLDFSAPIFLYFLSSALLYSSLSFSTLLTSTLLYSTHLFSSILYNLSLHTSPFLPSPYLTSLHSNYSFCSQLVALEELQLFGNHLSGAIPASLGNLVELKLLSLGEYTGTFENSILH